MRWSLVLVFAACLLVPSLVLGVLRYGPDPVRIAATKPLIHREGDFVGSMACKSCHPDRHASWAGTFHATMTQRPEGDAVVGRFDGTEVLLFGARARPFARGGKFWFDLPAGSQRREVEVALAVGSHRYQQYFEKEQRGEGFAFLRIPLVWHIEQQRWLHMNAVFLEPDDPNWDKHKSLWNENCIFCHNTGPNPRFVNFATMPDSAGRQFDSAVGELGIACEACHGPGREHVARHRAPLGRYAAHFGTGRDPTIVHPAHLDKQRSVDICGQCHGQRLPSPRERIAAWMQSGPTFRAGNLLQEHVSPITMATRSPRASSPDEFEPRFWRDGTARLTAYEYQGVVASPCFLRGEMTCSSCHTMHAGDPRGQLTPEMRGDQACLQCHQQIGKEISAHTKHEPASSGSRCLECHMPRIVYGILAVHRSHRIESPDAARDAEAGRPNACTLCHLDRSPVWAARETSRLWGKPLAEPRSRPDGAPLELPDALASLLCGDALQRAMFASAAGRSGIAVPHKDLAALRTHLIVTLCDAYPSVRHFAHESSKALERSLPAGLAEPLERYDWLAVDEARRTSAYELFEALARGGQGVLTTPDPATLVGKDLRPDLPAIVKLLDRQSKQVVSIGE